MLALKTKFFPFLMVISMQLVICYATPQSYNIPASAECVSKKTSCSESMASKSVICKPRTKVILQPEACIKTACKYCMWPSQKKSSMCKSGALAEECFRPEVLVELELKNMLAHTTEPSPEGEQYADPETCVWKDEQRDKVVISLAHVTASSYWYKNGGGLTWRKYGNLDIDSPGSGAKCFHFKVPSTGTYYLTMVSSAPHPIDHNDIWIKLSSGLGVYHLKTGGFLHDTFNYTKAYQNQGKNLLEYVLYTVDKNPHYFVSKTMIQNEPYDVCVSGRSSRFTIYKIVLLKCSVIIPNSCSPHRWNIKSALEDLEESECV